MKPRTAREQEIKQSALVEGRNDALECAAGMIQEIIDSVSHLDLNKSAGSGRDVILLLRKIKEKVLEGVE